MDGKHKKEEAKLRIVFKEVKGISEEEIQCRMNAVFDILFSEVIKRRYSE